MRFLLSIFLILGLSGCAALKEVETPAHHIAVAEKVEGRRVSKACLPFAENLVSKLKEAGVEARVVRILYQPDLKAPGHAVVLYKDGGNNYMIDNFTFNSIRVSNSHDDLYRVREFYVMSVGGNPFDIWKAW